MKQLMTLKSKVSMVILALASMGYAPAQGANWYVDNSLSNSANTGNNWASAWTNYSSIAWTSVRPGDTVYLSGGAVSQTYPAPFTVGAEGTANNYVTVATGRDAGHNGKVIIDAQNQLNFANGTDCVGIACGASWVHVTGLPGTNLVIQNVAPVLAFTPGNREMGKAFYAGIPHNQLIEGLVISNACNGFYYNGMLDIEVAYCSITGISGDYCFRFNGYGGPLSTNSMNAHVHHCTAMLYSDFIGGSGGPDGLQCENGVTLNDCTFRCTNGVVALGQHPDGIQTSGNYNRVYNNYFANFLNSGIKFEPLAPETQWVECYAYNNIVTVDDPQFTSNPLTNGKGTEIGSAGSMSNVQNIVIANNSFVGLMGMAVNGGGGTWPITSLVVENNLMYNCGGNGAGTLAAAIGPTKMVFDYNLINAGPSGKAQVLIDALGNGATYVTYLQAHGQTRAPVLVNYVQLHVNNDFHLGAVDTAATGKGLNLSAYIPALDKDGKTRSATEAWDIGAYVNPGNSDGTASTNQPAPSQVQGLHVISSPL